MFVSLVSLVLVELLVISFYVILVSYSLNRAVSSNNI